MSALLAVRHLSVAFEQPRFPPWRAPTRNVVVRDVSLDVRRREILGLIGESGSGKTTLSRAILRLLPAQTGSVWLDGTDVLGARAEALMALRRRMQMIFQDPYTSLNPRMTAGQIVAEGLLLQHVCSGREARARAAEILAEVGLPADSASRYPHEFSGGQRQRIGIARALAGGPEFLIADEPVAALDMSIQAHILNLLLEQQERRAFAMLFVGHDLSVIRHLCDRAVVLYRGEVMETAAVASLFDAPAHPYTRALLAAAPVSHPSLRRDRAPQPAAAPSAGAGCRYAERCPMRVTACDETPPGLYRLAEGHLVRCIRVGGTQTSQ